MKQEKQMLGGWELPVTTVDTVVIGSGCAGLNAADSLYDLGCRDLLLVTEGWHRGTSRNTGSDKQTYYKLSLSGDETDSVAEMARTLFAGGAVNGDTALADCFLSSILKRIWSISYRIFVLLIIEISIKT